MRLYALEYHRQADAGSANLSALFPFSLEKGFKYPRALIFRDSRARVRELEHKSVVRFVSPYRYYATFWREFHRIGQQIVENGADLVAIGGHDDVCDIEAQLDVGALQNQSLRFCHADHEGPQREVAERQDLVLGLPRAEAQQVLNQLLQLQSVHAQDVSDFALRLIELANGAIEQQVSALAYVGQRRLQFMRHVAQEAVLFLGQFEQAHAQPFELAAEPLEIGRALDHDWLREAALAEL